MFGFAFGYRDVIYMCFCNLWFSLTLFQIMMSYRFHHSSDRLKIKSIIDNTKS